MDILWSLPFSNNNDTDRHPYETSPSQQAFSFKQFTLFHYGTQTQMNLTYVGKISITERGNL